MVLNLRYISIIGCVTSTDGPGSTDLADSLLATPTALGASRRDGGKFGSLAQAARSHGTPNKPPRVRLPGRKVCVE